MSRLRPLGGKPVVIFPDYVKQADFKFGVQ